MSLSNSLTHMDSGRRIVSNLDFLEFHVPRFAHISRVADIDYVEYFVRYGPPSLNKMFLRFMFGGSVGGYSPQGLANTSIKWTARDLLCDGSPIGRDWRGVTHDAPSKAADYFDKILDSVSCGKGPRGNR